MHAPALQDRHWMPPTAVHSSHLLVAACAQVQGPGMKRVFMAAKSLQVLRARFVPSWNNAHLDPESLSSPCTACMRLCLQSR